MYQRLHNAYLLWRNDVNIGTPPLVEYKVRTTLQNRPLLSVDSQWREGL